MRTEKKKPGLKGCSPNTTEQSASDPKPVPRPALRILIVDDHPLVRFALKQVLSTGLENVIVEEAQSGDEALAKIQKLPLDVVILDVVMAGRNGLEILPDIKALRPTLPVIMLTAHPEGELALRTLRGGATGFVGKNTSNQDLVAAVKQVLGGNRCLSAEVAQAVALGLATTGTSPIHEALSNREYEVLCFIGAGHTTKDIAVRLGVSIKSINTYRMRLLQKMNMHTNAELVRYAVRHGLDNLS